MQLCSKQAINLNIRAIRTICALIEFIHVQEREILLGGLDRNV
jgi:hypothetical protein